MQLDYRALDEPLQIKGNKVAGYAAVFNKNSRKLPGGSYFPEGFVERIAPGAFSRSLAERPLALLLGHNTAQVMGTTESNLRVHEDHRGLAIEAELPDTSYVRDLRALIESGVYRGMSFGMRPEGTKDSWKGNVRTLHDVDLFEVSVVAIPAYPDTTVALRSFSEQNPTANRLRVAKQRLKLHDHLMGGK